MNKSSDTVIIAHDFLCPWCWIGLFQAKRLQGEFPTLKQDWRGYELLPESLGPLPVFTPRPPQPPDPSRPPSRLDQLAALDGIPYRKNRAIGAVRTHDALQGCEYAKELAPDKFDAYNEGVYRAYWERDEDISDHNVLGKIASDSGLDGADFLRQIADKRYSHLIVPYDDPAYADDITHVPTFMFRGERCAEAPYETIRLMAARFLAWYGPK
ncbi:MAG TPA: DsbA family protein [Capsulimonadaceae bacterium]|jgi:predicted DsbA family dithiol-disulfide isomerase